MSRQRNKNRLTNDLDSSEEEKDFSDFYSDEAPKEKRKPSDPEDILSRRNTWVIGIFILIAILWRFDWSPMKAAYGIGSSISNLFQSSDQVTTSQSTVINYTQLEYFDTIKDLNFDGTPTLDNTSILYQNRVPVEYLQALDDLDYLSDLTPNQALALHSSGVDIEFIEVMEELDYLDEVSYSGIIGMSSSGVSMDYLRTLDDVDYLDEISYSGIIGMYSNGVTEEFLRELEDRDMLEDLSYSQIIRLYNQN